MNSSEHGRTINFLDGTNMRTLSGAGKEMTKFMGTQKMIFFMENQEKTNSTVRKGMTY